MPLLFKRAYLTGTAYRDTRIRGYMWGNTGKIVLLVHGWESSSRIFESFVSPLLASGYRVMAIDGPAHADSTQKQTNMVDFGDALYKIVQRLEKSGGVYALIGHSFGGSSLINMLYRRSTPGTLKKIVIIASPSRIDNIFSNFFQYLHLPERVIKEFKILMAKNFNLKIEDLKLENWVHDLSLDKVLIVHDRNDKIIPYKEAEALVQAWKKSRFLLTEGLGHNRIMKNPEVIDEIINYLQEEETIAFHKIEVNPINNKIIAEN